MEELINYFHSLGIKVNLNTKARGHHGCFMKDRIDISKNTPHEKVIPTLLHEFAHYVHYNLEPQMHRNGGTLGKLFEIEHPIYAAELIKVTNFVDKQSLFERLLDHKNLLKAKINKYEDIIKADYPDFQRSKEFKEFEKFIRGSKAKYLLKYDRVRVLSGFFNHKVEVLSINTLESDFPNMPHAFAAYFRLRSAQRKQRRMSARINKLKKYYNKPSELFARLVEGLYLDCEKVCALAPCTTQRFFELLDQGYYKELIPVRKYLRNE
jgi:hypothetical protein